VSERDRERERERERDVDAAEEKAGQGEASPENQERRSSDIQERRGSDIQEVLVEDEELHFSLMGSIIGLAFIAVVVALISDILVGSIEV